CAVRIDAGILVKWGHPAQREPGRILRGDVQRDAHLNGAQIDLPVWIGASAPDRRASVDLVRSSVDELLKNILNYSALFGQLIQSHFSSEDARGTIKFGLRI